MELTIEQQRAIIAEIRATHGPSLRCYHERVKGASGRWTCVSCGDTVDSLPTGERPYDTSGDF